MDRVTRCLNCGKRMVPAPAPSGRTELKCLFCDDLDRIKIDKPADGPLAKPGSELPT